MLNMLFGRISTQNIYLIFIIGLIIVAGMELIPKSGVLQIIQILIILILIGWAFLHYHKASTTSESASVPEELPHIEEDDHDWLKIESKQNIEENFERFLESTLTLIKRVIVSDSIVLLFANYSKKLFSIRAHVTSNTEQFTPKNSIDLLKGLPSLVLRNRTPLIENHLPEGSEIIPYYQTGKNPAASFAGVPIHFNNMIIGVLCADTRVEEAFGNEDLDILQNFSSLISSQLINSNKLYEYETENWVGNILFDVSNEINKIRSVDELWDYLAAAIPGIVECDRISICRRSDETTGEILRLDGGTGNLKSGIRFPLTEGIVGWVLRKNQTLMVDDFSAKPNYVPRFFSAETPAKDYFSLLAVPITTGKYPIGAICLESTRPNNYSEQHKRILQTIANQVATAFQTVSSLEQLKTSHFKDTETELKNLNAYREIVPTIVKQARKFNLDYTQIFIKTYFQVKEDNPEQIRETIAEFLTLILPSLPETDYIFRLYSDTFTVSALNWQKSKVTEYVKNLIADVSQKKVWAGGQAFDFYVNIGIVPLAFVSVNCEEILEKGSQSIQTARLKGPNQYAFFDEQPPEPASILPDSQA